MACILLWSSAVRVHDSQAYRKTDVTRESISRILELREMLLSIQTGFMGPVLSHHTSEERQPAAVPELRNNKPHQSPKQSHAEDHTEQIEATSGEDHRRRTGRLHSRNEYYRANLQPTHSM